VSDVEPALATDAAVATHRRREDRCEGVIEQPFNERTAVTCPACGVSFESTICTSDPAGYSPSFGTCPAWDCDALVKFRWDGTGPASASDDTDRQVDLSAFAGGDGR
jgi:hypothetical protein